MLQNAQDLLTIVKAISLLGFVFFVCWGLYYFAMILRQGYLIIKEMRDRIHMVDETIKAFKEKIEHSTSDEGSSITDSNASDFSAQRRLMNRPDFGRLLGEKHAQHRFQFVAREAVSKSGF